MVATPCARWNDHTGVVLAQRLDYTVINCMSCGWFHAIPLPDAAWLAGYYQDTFYTRSHPDYVARYQTDATWWGVVHAGTLRTAAQWLRVNGTQPRVLDIGTGPGLFLDTAQALNWETFGIEPDAALATDAQDRGHHVLAGTLADYDDGLQMHLVHAYEVLEHVLDPAAFLRQCYDLLLPGGLLCVTVPNDFNPLQLQACEQLGLDPWWVQPPEHLHYWQPASLQALLEQCGFSLVDLRGTFPLEQFLLRGTNYIDNDALGRECHEKRMRYELRASRAGAWATLMQSYRHQLQDHGIGREIVAIAKKD